jgi:hypothetical protein
MFRCRYLFRSNKDNYSLFRLANRISEPVRIDIPTCRILLLYSKTADLQSGIDGVTERFENLRIGQKNLILNSDKIPFKIGGDGTLISENDYFVFTSTGYTSNSYAGVSWNLSIDNVKIDEEFPVFCFRV